MWKHCETCFAETVKNNPEEFVKSSALHTFSAFFPFWYPGEENMAYGWTDIWF